MSKTFPQESSEAFLELKKVCITHNKKNSPACFNSVLWEVLRKKDMVLFGFSKNKVFWHSPTSFEQAYGFHNKTTGKTVQR